MKSFHLKANPQGQVCGCPYIQQTLTRGNFKAMVGEVLADLPELRNEIEGKNMMTVWKIKPINVLSSRSHHQVCSYYTVLFLSAFTLLLCRDLQSIHPINPLHDFPFHLGRVKPSCLAFLSVHLYFSSPPWAVY